MTQAKRVVALVLIVLALVAGLVLGLFNAQTVAFNYLLGEVELPLIALMVASALFALLFAVIASALPMLRHKRKIARLQREVETLRAQSNVERQLPASHS